MSNNDGCRLKEHFEKFSTEVSFVLIWYYYFLKLVLEYLIIGHEETFYPLKSRLK